MFHGKKSVASIGEKVGNSISNMVIAERNESSSSYGSSGTAVRRTRTLNTAPSSSNIASNSSSNLGSCSSDINSDSDSEQSVRVGNDYQADIPDMCLAKPAAEDYPEKAVMIWTWKNDVDEDQLKEYIKLAKEKYNYDLEQALGMLFWHDFDLQCALADLPNYAPYPDEWSLEDQALFEQAYQFHSKNFHKINQLLPEKKISSLVKYYYMWKKVKTRSSYVEKQMKKANSKDDAGEDGLMDFENYSVDANSTSGSMVKDQLQERRECSQCSNKNSSKYFNTKFGILCKACYSKRKNISKSSNHRTEDVSDQSPQEEPPKFMERLNSILSDEALLNEIARERFTGSTSKVLDGYEHEIKELNTKIRELKQENSEKKASLQELPDFSSLAQNNRIISRWANEEIVLMTQAIRDYGKDFKVITEIIGTKTEAQIKNYFLQNQDKLDLLVKEFNEENDIAADEMEIVTETVSETSGSKTTK